MLGKLFVVAAIIFVIIALRSMRRKKISLPEEMKENTAALLEDHVPFYQKLGTDERRQFEARVLHFLATTHITGIGVAVTYTDKLLVAASAIIPIHHFPGWEYRNIQEVLLYNNTFSKEYSTEGEDRNILGMVGDGAMNGQMILSLPSLRSGFKSADGHNTAIHEFVHLIDKADGSVDGVPEYLLKSPFVIPWIKLMHDEIRKIRQERSEINPYGATNDAEFFAVIAEYFFEKPEALKAKHPELYRMLEMMFDGRPANDSQAV